MAKQSASASVTILAGQSVSSAVDLTNSVVAMVLTPPEWTPANISFLVSMDNVNFFDLFDVNGVEVTKPVRAGSGVIVDQSLTSAAMFLKIRSGHRDNPVLQDADRVVKLTLV